MKQALEQGLGQHLAMTPRMRQAIRLLQLSSVELRDELRELAESNYMLELEDDPPREDWEGALATARDGRGTEIISNAEESLRDHLFWQLANARFSDADHLIGTVIIDSVDEHGYLHGSVRELLETLGRQGLETDAEAVETVLRRVQRFDPPGVAARTLSECLLRQLEETATGTPHRDLAVRIARTHLESVARGNLDGLKRTLRATREELDGALALLRRLNPRPGATFAGSPTEYVIPDLRVFRAGRNWQVELNPEAAPKLRINALYAGLVGRDNRAADNRSLKKNLSEARALVRSLGNRAETMLRVVRTLVRHQSAFLERGDEELRPLGLRDVALELGLHESTVSRATNGKYAQTPRGVFELKRFFSNEVSTADGGSTSATAVRAHLRKIIEGEEPGRPFSDRRLASGLQQAGFRVARRTVAKYRESMGIPPSNERRRAGAVNLRASA